MSFQREYQKLKHKMGMGEWSGGNPDYNKFIDFEIPEKDKLLFVQMKQSKDIGIIKNCVIFFVAMTVIGLLAYIIVVYR